LVYKIGDGGKQNVKTNVGIIMVSFFKSLYMDQPICK